MSIDTVSPDCALKGMGYIESWYLMQAIPIVAVLLLVAALAHNWLQRQCLHGDGTDRGRPSASVSAARDSGRAADGTSAQNNHQLHVQVTSASLVPPMRGISNGVTHSGVITAINVCIVVFDVLYVILLKKALEVHRCTTVGTESEHRLIADPAVVCAGPMYDQLKTVSSLSIAAYGFGTPLAFAVLLWWYRQLFTAEQSRRDCGMTENAFVGLHRRFKRLYGRFTPQHFYWTLAIIARKAVVVCAGFFFQDEPVYAASVTAMALLASQVLQRSQSPYR